MSRTMWSDTICCFFFNDPAATEIYTLSQHDALPICLVMIRRLDFAAAERAAQLGRAVPSGEAPRQLVWTAVGIAALVGVLLLDRKSTRLNSSHANISYAVFCLKKKNTLPLSSHHILY